MPMPIKVDKDWTVWLDEGYVRFAYEGKGGSWIPADVVAAACRGMNHLHQWEHVAGGSDEDEGWPWETTRMRAPGGWLYLHTVNTAIGPHMTTVFVPLAECERE